jgi:hypothetical protein
MKKQKNKGDKILKVIKIVLILLLINSCESKSTEIVPEVVIPEQEDTSLKKHFSFRKAINTNDTILYNELFRWGSVYEKSNSYLYYSLCMAEINGYSKAYYDFALGHTLYSRIDGVKAKDEFIIKYLSLAKESGYKFKDIKSDNVTYYYDSIPGNVPNGTFDEK